MPRRIPPHTVLLFLTLTAIMLAAPAVALSAGDGIPNPQPTLALPALQVYALLAGAITPLVTYVLNHHAPWANEPFKSFILVIAAAIAGTLAQIVDVGHVGTLNETIQLCFSSVVAALTAHRFLWAPSGISTRLGGGTNA